MNIHFKAALAIFAAIGVAGCQSFPGSGPRMESLISGKQDMHLPVDVVVLSPDTVGQYSKPRRRDLPAPDRVPASALEYRLVPGDVIRVTVFEAVDGGTFKSIASGGAVFDNMRIDSDGNIAIPYVHPSGGKTTTGPIRAAGLTRQGLREAILRDLEGKANQPQVLVDLVISNDQVAVSGDVKTPGSFALVDGPQTVLDAINKAGGPNQPPLQTDVVVRRKGTVSRLWMVDLLLQGGDQTLRPGDDIVVEANTRTFTAMGAVKLPGPGSAIFPFPKAGLSLQEALGTVGGLADNQADPTGVFVFRGYASAASDADKPKPQVFALNYTDPTAVFLANSFTVEPGDAIYVTNSPVYQFGKIISILSGAGGLVTNGKSLTGQ